MQQPPEEALEWPRFLLYESVLLRPLSNLKITKTTATTSNIWIKALVTRKAKNPKAHPTTSMIIIVSSIFTSTYFLCSLFFITWIGNPMVLCN
jgi:hypothetical protein